MFWRQGGALGLRTRVAFWALGEIVKAHAGVLESDDAETAARRLDLAVEAVIGDDCGRTLVRARLAPLVGLVSGDQQFGPRGTARSRSPPGDKVSSRGSATEPGPSSWWSRTCTGRATRCWASSSAW